MFVSTTTFVGRQRELEILARKLDDAFSGRGGLVILAGEAGIGKTRIAEEFARHARQRGAVVLRGFCLEGDWQRPYGPWVEALGEYARANDPHRLRQELGPGAGPLAQLLPEVRVALPDSPVATQLSPDEERFRIYDAVIQFVLSLAREKPLLLVLDDLQWADRDSLRLLRHLARFVEQAPVVVVGAYRDPDLDLDGRYLLPDLLAILRRETDYEHVVVRGLGSSESAEYLAEAAGQPLPEPLAQAIHSETGGNPFYIREVLRHLVEEGRLHRDSEPWPTGLSVRDLGIPEGVRQVIGRRISRLSRDTAALLSLASGFTGGFQFSTLRALTGLPEEALLDYLDEAIEAGFVRVAQSMPPTYDFAHAIVRHAVYSQMNPDRRVRLHRRIASALERGSAGRESDCAAELAFQYHSSATLPGGAKGIPYAVMAAERARARYAFEQAAVFLRMARDLSAESQPPIKADLLIKLAIAEAEALLLEEAQRSVEEALDALSAVGEETKARAEFVARIARVLKDGGADPSIWEPLVERGLALVGDQRDLLWARLVLLQDRFEPLSHGTIEFGRWMGHNPEAVAIVRAGGDEDDYARTLDSLERPTRHGTEAVRSLARSWRSPSAIMCALDIAARDLFYRHGAFKEAATQYQELLAVGARYGSILEQAEALAQLAVTRAILGDLSEARETARRAQEMIARLGSAHGLHFVQAALWTMLAYHFDGDWPSLAVAAGRFAAGPAVARPSQPMIKVGLAAAAIAAFAHSRAGNKPEARRYLLALTPVVERMEPTAFAHNGVVTIAATAVWDLGAVKFASAYRQMALALVAAGVGIGPVGPHELAIARMAALLGDLAEAGRYFDRARRVAEAEGLRPSRAIVDYDEALALLHAGHADHARVGALLGAALAAFQALGMEGWAKRALDHEERLASPQPTPPSSTFSSPAPSPDSGLGLPRQKGPISDREREVAALIAAGLSNAEIADRLVISVRTAESHVAHILDKLGFSSRAQVAAWAVKQELDTSRFPSIGDRS